MKVALLLSGLARNVSEGYNLYFKHLIEKYNIDVYCHFWEDGEWNQVLNYYTPISYICDKPFSFHEYKINIESPGDNFARPIVPYNVSGNFTSLPMFYGWQRIYSLVKDEYDVIIKSRYDLGWDFLPDLLSLDFTKINISNHHWTNNEILDDNLSIMNGQLAKLLFSDIFNEFIKNIKKEGIIYFPEKNFTNLVVKKDLYKFIFKTDQLPFRLLREFKVWY